MSIDCGLKLAGCRRDGTVKPTKVVAEVLRARARGGCARLRETGCGHKRHWFEQAGSEGLG